MICVEFFLKLSGKVRSNLLFKSSKIEYRNYRRQGIKNQNLKSYLGLGCFIRLQSSDLDSISDHLRSEKFRRIKSPIDQQQNNVFFLSDLLYSLLLGKKTYIFFIIVSKVTRVIKFGYYEKDGSDIIIILLLKHIFQTYKKIIRNVYMNYCY